ncbi:MAG TPA: hypothetical protein DEB46_09515 [Myxococcales bacterium]|nr:hypothetical protein [Myxococcales bacterium]
MHMNRVIVMLSLWLVGACSRSALLVSVSVVPDSGPSLLRLTGLPPGIVFASYDNERLPLQADGLNYRVQIPARPPGQYLLVVDNFEAEINVVSGRLRVHVLDVGQGDATLIETPGGQRILVDSGAPEAALGLRAALARYNVDSLDLAVATHMDADHIGGFSGLVAGADEQLETFDDFKVDSWLDSGDAESCTSQVCAAYRTVAVGRRQIEASDDFDRLGGFVLRTLARGGEVFGAGTIPASDDHPASTSDDNARSVVLSLEFNGFRMLLMGDLTGGGLGSPDMEGLLAPSLERVNVLRTGHHGSRTSSSGAFIAATSPQVSLLSYGEDNPHCHPVGEVVERLGNVGWVYGTNPSQQAGCPNWEWPARGSDDCGDITIESARGSQFSVRCAGREVTF